MARLRFSYATTAEIALTTAQKTLVQLASPANQRVAIKAFNVSTVSVALGTDNFESITTSATVNAVAVGDVVRVDGGAAGSLLQGLEATSKALA